jgi:hypothetical protein
MRLVRRIPWLVLSIVLMAVAVGVVGLPGAPAAASTVGTLSVGTPMVDHTPDPIGMRAHSAPLTWPSGRR